MNLVNAVEDLDIPISGNEEVVKFEEAKATVTKYWDAIQAKTQNVPKRMCFSVGDGNDQSLMSPATAPLPMASSSENLSDPDTVCPCPATKDALSYLWYCPSIQKAYERRHEIQLSDSAAYFLNDLDRVCNHDYEPTDEDVLRTRVRTVGIVKIEFAFRHLTVSKNDTFISIVWKNIQSNHYDKHSLNYPFLYFQFNMYDVGKCRPVSFKSRTNLDLIFDEYVI